MGSQMHHVGSIIIKQTAKSLIFGFFILTQVIAMATMVTMAIVAMMVPDIPTTIKMPLTITKTAVRITTILEITRIMLAPALVQIKICQTATAPTPMT